MAGNDTKFTIGIGARRVGLRTRWTTILVAVLATLAAHANPATVYAQTQSGTWTLVGSSTWGNTAAWSGGLVAGGANNTASVTVAGTAALTSNITLGNLTTSSGRVQIVGLDASPSAYQLQFATTTGTAPTITNAGRLDMRPTITGTQGFRKVGTGDMYLWQTNTYTGTTTLTAGRTRLQNGGGLGSTAEGTVVLPAATLMIDGAVTVDAEPLTISGTGNANQGSLRQQSGDGTFAGPITLTGSANITANIGATLTLSGSIDPNSYQLNLGDGGNYIVSGGFVGTSGTVSFTGPGLIFLSGSSSFAGTTSVGNATGLVTMTGFMAGLMDFTPGAARTLVGTGTFNGGLSMGQNATLAPGASDASTDYGTITTTTLNLINGTVALGIQDATTYDRLVMTAGSDGLTLQGESKPLLTLDFANAITSGTLDLFSFTGLSGSFQGVSSTGVYVGAWVNSGDTWSLQSQNQTLTFSASTGDLVVVPEPSAIALLGASLAAACLIRRRRQGTPD